MKEWVLAGAAVILVIGAVLAGVFVGVILALLIINVI